MTRLRAATCLSHAVRSRWLIAGTIIAALVGPGQPCRADFSAANFKRIWFETFGPGLSPAEQQVPATRTDSLAGMPAFQTQQPHPAVARIIVPEGDAMSFGSGTLVDVRDDFGIVVTNWHVVRDAQGPIDVIFPDGFTSKARPLKVDADWDLAALVIWRPPVDAVKIATVAPQPGDPLTICGYGPGIYRAATGRCTQYYSPGKHLPQQMVELNVEARQGDSGGPIFNSRGELAGVLFGASNGTTLGSYGGRVDQFLASLAPDIGKESAVHVAEVQKPATPAVIAVADEPSAESWSSTVSHQSVRGDVQTASTTLLEPPAFEDLEHVEEAEHATPLNSLVVTEQTTAPADTDPSLLFEQIKTGLAAFGVLSIAMLLLKAAG